MEGPSCCGAVFLAQVLGKLVKVMDFTHYQQILSELEALCAEEWSKIPPARLQGLVSGDTRRLILQQKKALPNIN